MKGKKEALQSSSKAVALSMIRAKNEVRIEVNIENESCSTK